MMKRFSLVASATLLFASGASALGPAPVRNEYVEVSAFDPARDAAKDIRQAIAEAKRTGRRVLLDVGGDWCIWCRRLDSLFVADQELEGFREKHYVTVKVNWSKENKNQKVLSRYPTISGYPHLFVLGSNGKLLKSQDTGELERGKGHDPVKVMTFLKTWTTGS